MITSGVAYKMFWFSV